MQRPAPLQALGARASWALDPAVTFLNHGSFGACPRAVLEAQGRLRDRMEREPVRFFVRDYEPLLDEARARLAAFLGADPEGLAPVRNATAGVNAVLRSVALAPGDELLTTDHAYGACLNALDFVAGRAGACVRVAHVPFPVRSAGEIVEALLSCASARTRLALVDHVTSPTALVFPVGPIFRELASRGIDCLVDGAHAPGMVPVEIDRLGAAYYVGNCHKWLCAPKGAGFLWVREDRRALVRPAVLSHGSRSGRRDRSRFRLEHDWCGTDDPTPFLVVPEALRLLGSQLDGGWPALMLRNHELAARGRELLCESLACEPPAPLTCIGSMASVLLPGEVGAPAAGADSDPLQAALFESHAIEVPVIAWPQARRRIVRVSAQLYNTLSDYERLAHALRQMPAP
jgi:isopenicillin-N epimerase